MVSLFFFIGLCFPSFSLGTFSSFSLKSSPRIFARPLRIAIEGLLYLDAFLLLLFDKAFFLFFCYLNPDIRLTGISGDRYMSLLLRYGDYEVELTLPSSSSSLISAELIDSGF